METSQLVGLVQKRPERGRTAIVGLENNDPVGLPIVSVLEKHPYIQGNTQLIDHRDRPG